jgi:hypothetical protein
VVGLTGPQGGPEGFAQAGTGRRARPIDSGNEAEAVPESLLAARRARESEPADATASSRSRRRVGWRKGSDVDQELWPAASFGGVSDEQFWDDLAADRPLATTARAAQPEAAGHRRPAQAGRLPELPSERSRPEPQAGARGRHAPVGADGSEPTNPHSAVTASRPDDQTAVQPAVTDLPRTASASAQATPPGPASRPARGASQPFPAATQPAPAAPQARTAYRGAQPVAQPAARPAVGPAGPAARPDMPITPGRAGEDPLTSPAYAQRAAGAVGGRSRSSASRSAEAAGGNTGPRQARPWADVLPQEQTWPGGSAGTAASPSYNPSAANGYDASPAGRYAPRPYSAPQAPPGASQNPPGASPSPLGTSAYPYPGTGRDTSPASDPGYGNRERNPAPGGGYGNAGRGGPPGYPPAPGYPTAQGYRPPQDPRAPRPPAR